MGSQKWSLTGRIQISACNKKHSWATVKLNNTKIEERTDMSLIWIEFTLKKKKKTWICKTSSWDVDPSLQKNVKPATPLCLNALCKNMRKDYRMQIFGTDKLTKLWKSLAIKSIFDFFLSRTLHYRQITTFLKINT